MRLFLSFLLLWEKDRVDVWKNTTLGNGDGAEKLVQFLVVSDSKLDVSWDDSGLLVVTGSVTSKLKDLSSQVLKDGCEVHRGTSTDAVGEASKLEVTVDTANRELKSGLA